MDCNAIWYGLVACARVLAVAACTTGIVACGGGGNGNVDLAPVPVVAIADASLAEGDAGQAIMEFTVTLSEATTVPVTVDYATVSDSATVGVDFSQTNGTLPFAPGLTSQMVQVPVFGDLDDEPDESFSVVLTNPVNATSGTAQAQGAILDNDPTPMVFGLDSRPSNTTCIAPPRPTAGATVETPEVYSAANLSLPTKILQPPGDATRWFVLEKAGRVKVFDVSTPGNIRTYLDFSAQTNSNYEGGLLGLAFHPNFPTTPEIFVSYTAIGPGPPGPEMVSRLSRVILDSTAAPTNPIEQVLLSVDQPGPFHKGGDIAFGPDGYLYLGLGDGGAPADISNPSQDTTKLLGSMLRIDVLGVPWPNPGYNLPADNPFAGHPRCGPNANAESCPEIYAWGFRNPWRWRFDQQTGNLWLSDVGNSNWEEVDVVSRGGNYGWPCREGAHDSLVSAACPSDLLDPVSEYSHANGDAAIVGGGVYRGSAIPALFGRYIFGDFGSGRLYALQDDGQGGYAIETLADTPYDISTFAIGNDGEVYFADYTASHRIHKVVPAGAGNPDTIPTDLAATGCANPANPTQPSTGLIPYSVNAPFWSDGAVKTRFLGLPNGTSINIDSSGDWELPPGSVIRKDFTLGAQFIETRLLMRHPDGIWAGYTYEWNDAQTAATRVKGGETRVIAGQSWIYPSEGQCMQCHTAAAGFSLGLETAQLNRMTTYPSTGRTADQLGALEHIGMLSSPLPDLPANLPALPDPGDSSLPLTTRARAWLHTNCAQCHRPGGSTQASMDLRSDISLSATNTCDIVPNLGDLGITNARLIAPGDATRSIIVNRIDRRDLHGMPPIGSNLVDSDGVALVSAWVNSLTSCN